MRHPPNASESASMTPRGPFGSSRRAIVRILGHNRSPGRRRPLSIEADAKLHTAHIRHAAFRPELY